MNLNVGKIVEEWNVSEHISLKEILSDSKRAQQTPSKTIVGIGNNEIFRIDPQISTPSKLVDSEFKSYKSKMGFSCATTTGKGELAVGNTLFK
jgi:hypothetical protein